MRKQHVGRARGQPIAEHAPGGAHADRVGQAYLAEQGDLRAHPPEVSRELSLVGQRERLIDRGDVRGRARQGDEHTLDPAIEVPAVKVQKSHHARATVRYTGASEAASRRQSNASTAFARARAPRLVLSTGS